MKTLSAASLILIAIHSLDAFATVGCEDNEIYYKAQCFTKCSPGRVATFGPQKLQCSTSEGTIKNALGNSSLGFLKVIRTNTSNLDQVRIFLLPDIHTEMVIDESLIRLTIQNRKNNAYFVTHAGKPEDLVLIESALNSKGPLLNTRMHFLMYGESGQNPSVELKSEMLPGVTSGMSTILGLERDSYLSTTISDQYFSYEERYSNDCVLTFIDGKYTMNDIARLRSNLANYRRMIRENFNETAERNRNYVEDLQMHLRWTSGLIFVAMGGSHYFDYGANSIPSLLANRGIPFALLQSSFYQEYSYYEPQDADPARQFPEMEKIINCAERTLRRRRVRCASEYNSISKIVNACNLHF